MRMKLTVLCLALFLPGFLAGCAGIETQMTKQLNIQHTDYHSENTSENQSKKRPEFLAADKEDKGQTNSSSTNNIRRQTPKENIKRTDIRGIYLNRNAIKSDAIDDYIDLVQSTDLNAFVMDVKDDNGKLTYDSNVPIAEEIKADGNPSVDDMKALLDRLEKEGIYTIARIVVFKDPFLAEQKKNLRSSVKMVVSGRMSRESSGLTRTKRCLGLHGFHFRGSGIIRI